jgi:hypothetical protein
MTGSISFSNGLNGIRIGLDGIHKTASQIASKESMQAGGARELAESLLDLKVYNYQVDASAKVVKATDQMLGSLLDIKA